MKRAGNLLLIICLLLSVSLLIFTLSEGKILFKVFGYRLLINPVSSLRFSSIFLLIGSLFLWKGEAFSSFLRRIFSNREDNIEKKNFILSYGLLVFLIAGFLLGLYDAFFDPETLKLTVYTPLQPLWNVRGERITNLLLYYSLPFTFCGLILSYLFVKLIRRREKIYLFLPASAFLTFSFLFKQTAFIKLEPYGTISFLDALVYAIITICFFFLLPRALMKKKFGFAFFCFILSSFILSTYFVAGYYEIKNKDEEAAKKHTRILLITMDTTRADHLSVKGYDYNKETSPGLRKIASEGVVFKNCYSEISTTEPSHTSIFTGTYPRTHGLRKNGDKVTNPNLNFLHSWLKKRGFTTAAITSRTLFSSEELGWPKFDFESYPRTRKHRSKRREIFVAKYAYKRAKDWIDNNYEKDFLLFVHFWDPHWPYIPPAPYRSRFNNGFKGYETRPSKRSFIKDKNKYSPEEMEYTVSMYDGEIAFTDEYVTKLVRYVESKIPSTSEPPLIIITADHGDVMGEMQEKLNFVFDHGETLNFGEVYIPLIIKWEGRIPAGKIFDDLVESVDIAPTILDLLEERGKFNYEGKSFAPLLFGKDYIPKDALFEQKRDYQGHPIAFVNAPEYAVTTKKWRLIVNDVRGIELYDVINDRLEQTNLAEKYPDVVKNLLAKLDDWKAKHPPAPRYEGKMSKKKTDVLKSLGYIQ